MFTFPVCGSMKTLTFLRWRGIDVPPWIENDLRHSTDPLAASLETVQTTAEELSDFFPPPGSVSRPQLGGRLDPPGRDRSVCGTRHGHTREKARAVQLGSRNHLTCRPWVVDSK